MYDICVKRHSTLKTHTMYILSPKCVPHSPASRSFRDEISPSTALGLVSEDAAPMPIGSGIAHTGEAESGAEEASAEPAALLERRAKDTERKRRWRQKRKTASSLAALAAAPPTICVVDAGGSHDAGNTKPSASVHTCGATVVRGIITNRHFKVSAFNALAPKMEGLFGEGVFENYAESAKRSNRYSMQLLPVVKGPRSQDAPWMEVMVKRVQDVLTELGILGPQHRLGAMTLLLSAEKACQQDWHCDFPWQHRVFNVRKSLEKNGSVPYPVSVLIACHKDGASLPVKGREVINFDQFSAVVFRGDLEHAGAAWSRRDWNFRIHMYFETRGDHLPRCKTCGVPYRGREGRDRQIVVCPCRPDERCNKKTVLRFLSSHNHAARLRLVTREVPFREHPVLVAWEVQGIHEVLDLWAREPEQLYKLLRSPRVEPPRSSRDAGADVMVIVLVIRHGRRGERVAYLACIAQGAQSASGD